MPHFILLIILSKNDTVQERNNKTTCTKYCIWSCESFDMYSNHYLLQFFLVAFIIVYQLIDFIIWLKRVFQNQFFKIAIRVNFRVIKFDKSNQAQFMFENFMVNWLI